MQGFCRIILFFIPNVKMTRGGAAVRRCGISKINIRGKFDYYNTYNYYIL